MRIVKNTTSSSFHPWVTLLCVLLNNSIVAFSPVAFCLPRISILGGKTTVLTRTSPTLTSTGLRDVDSGSNADLHFSISSSQDGDELRQYSRAIQSSKHNATLAIKSIRSLKRYLDNSIDTTSDASTQSTPSSSSSSLHLSNSDLGDVLSTTLIRAFRTCGDAGDYRMIISLLQSALVLCRGSPQHCLTLSPRVVGEALDALSRTDASVSKLKQAYNWATIEYSDALNKPLGAYELNVMLKALGKKKKVQAALDLYRSTDIVGDAFTASTLLNLLTLSITDDQEVSTGWTMGDISPCWQHEQGMEVIRETKALNNFVFSAALKLNERASQVFYQPGRRHNGAKSALDLLGLMKQQNILPDLVTCTHVLSAFDKHREWKAAVVMLTSMEKSNSNEKDGWHLPAPNEYAYSATISACARCDQYDEAIRLLERMKRSTSPVKPNTWVYNAVLSACVSPSKKNRSDRIRMALSLLEDMQRESSKGNAASAPDTVTYNTALAVMDGLGIVFRDEKGRRVCEYSASEPETWLPSENLILEVLQDMRFENIPRDALTYHNAIQASKSNSRMIFELLEQATEDLENENSRSTLNGRAGDGLGFVFNAALAAFSNRGDMDLVLRALNMMRVQNIGATRESIIHLVVALGRSRNSRDIMTLLETLRGNRVASNMLQERYGLDLSVVTMKGHSKELENLYAVSISSCLVANDIESASSILNLMKTSGMSPSQSTMKGIAFAYTRLAVDAAKLHSIRRRKLAKNDIIHEPEGHVGSPGEFHAQRAGAIVRELQDVSPQLLSSVACAYAATGSFEQARAILRRLHQAALAEHRNSKLLSRGEQEIVDVLPRLHRSLLKICAGPGNVKAAYSFVEEIQNFANDLSSHSREICLADAPLIPDVSDPADFKDVNMLRFYRTHTDAARKAGMRGEDWKLLLISASKAGDWKLCINTLQFLRPFLEAYHPSRETRSNSDSLSRKYRKLARALTASVLCFEERGHSAWAVRTIDDWIEWSGRRPPKEAVLASIRILASLGRGTEVTSLIQQVLQVKASASDRGEEAQHTYEEILYIGAITHLHNNGLYEDADELYLQAVTNQHLPFSVANPGKDGHQYLDLHGMNVAIANSAVRIAFQQDVLQSNAVGDLVIVTGRGVNSFYQMRPILRPEIQRMLTEEFYPPLSSFSIPGNMGALRVPAEDIQEWVEHQRQQKGVKMLAVAGALKSLSTALLRKSLNLSLGRTQEKQD